MAFTGAAVVQKVTDGKFRITGLSLAAGAAGTIGLDGGTGEVDLPANWEPYADVTLIEAVKVSVVLAGAAAVAPAIQVGKAGTTSADFLATLTNGGAAPSGDLEIWVEFH